MITSDTGFVKRKNHISLTLLVAIFCIVDILMLPYLRALSCSMSMLLMLIWYGLHIKNVAFKMEIYAAIALIVISIALGYVQRSSIGSLSVGAILIFALLFFFFLQKQLADDDRLKNVVSKILFVYITLVFAFALLYIVWPETYFSIRSFWTMGHTQIDFSSRIINRYTFIYSDPNNAGCSFVAILAYVLICEKHTPITYVYYMGALTISVFVTFSLQAMLAFFAVVFIIIFVLKKIDVRAKVVILIIIVIAIAVTWLNADTLMNNAIFRTIAYRWENSNVSSAGGRVSFWKDTLNNALSWYNIFIGKGAVVDTNGVSYLPHSGHLYTMISFGLLTDIVFCKTLFLLPRKSKWIYYAILMPMFVAFTINTGVSDYRFICTLVLLSACVSSNGIKNTDISIAAKKSFDA